MEQEMLVKILEMTEETNRTVNATASAIITMQQDISELKERVTKLEQDVIDIRKEMVEMEDRIMEKMVAMEDRIMKAINAEVKDAVKDHVFMIKNLSNVMHHLNLEVVS